MCSQQSSKITEVSHAKITEASNSKIAKASQLKITQVHYSEITTEDTASTRNKEVNVNSCDALLSANTISSAP